DRADGAIRAGRNGQDLVVVTLLEIDLRIIGVIRIDRDTLDLNGAGRRRIVGRTDGRGIGNDQLAGFVIAANLLASLVRDDAGHLGPDRLAEIGNLHDRTGLVEVYAGIDLFQIGFVYMKLFTQHFG